MGVVTVGVGQAGCAILDELYEDETFELIAEPMAVNSTMRDLSNLTNLGQEHWWGISDSRGLVYCAEPGLAPEEHVVGGLGKDPVLATEVMERNFGSVLEALDEFGDFDEPDEHGGDDRFDTLEAEIDFAFVLFALGGGTGAGAAPEMARAIREISVSESTAVIGVPILPAVQRGDEGLDPGVGRECWNARYSLQKAEEVFDGVLLVDNQCIAMSSGIEGMFPDYNRYVAACLKDVIGGSILEEISPDQYPDFVPQEADLRDLVSGISFDTSDGRRPGYASIGRAADLTSNLLGYVLPGNLGREEVDVAGLYHLCTEKQTLAGADPAESRKAFAMMRLPLDLLNEDTGKLDTANLLGVLNEATQMSEVHYGMAVSERKIASLTAAFTYERDQIDRFDDISYIAEEYEDLQDGGRPEEDEAEVEAT